MFLNSWAIALSLVSLLSCFLMVMAGKTAIRVLRYWDLDSDANMQIKLEGEIWLSSTLVLYGACFQIISLILFIFAADHFAGFIAGAMCATGSLLANGYGMPLLYVKIISSFAAALWIVIHRLDISSEEYPLVRLKYVLLLFLVPLLATDFYLQIQYIRNLSPDIITSCCAIVFDAVERANTLTGYLESPLVIFYWYGFGLFLLGFIALKSESRPWAYCYSVAICGWLLLSIDTIISRLSSFIYAMPYHNCPFCIVKSEYHFIGFFIYFCLFASCFLGFSSGFLQLFHQNKSLQKVIQLSTYSYQKYSLIFLLLFIGLSSYHLVIYRFWGGER